jgi:hypothetical protein
MSDEYDAISHRMLRDLDHDDHEPNRKPRCEGCGARVPLQAYNMSASSESDDWVMYCAQCRALADLEEQ